MVKILFASERGRRNERSNYGGDLADHFGLDANAELLLRNEAGCVGM